MGKHYPYGDSRNSQGTLGTDKLFTGQRLDGTGLYYYGARYYDPTIGRFISADILVQNPANPQTLNRYTYALNNPLKYVDPSGHLTGTVTIEDERYTLVEDSGGNHHLVAPDMSETASMGLAELLEMTSGYMEQVGDYSYGGDEDSGPVIRVDVQTNFLQEPIPVNFVPEGWVSSHKGESLPNVAFTLANSLISGKSVAATTMSFYDAIGISLDFEGGAFVRYQYINQLYQGTAPQLVSGIIEDTTYHESFHYYEQVGPQGGFNWYLSYIVDVGWREAAEARAKYWAQYHDQFYDPRQGWRSP